MGKKARKAASDRRLSEKRARRSRNQTLYQERAKAGQNTLSKRNRLNLKRQHRVRTKRDKTESPYPAPKMNDPNRKFLRFDSGPLKGQVKRTLTPGEIDALKIQKDPKWNNASEYVGYLSRVRGGDG